MITLSEEEHSEERRKVKGEPDNPIGGTSVKGEEKAIEVVSKLFRPEEKIVEREIGRPLTSTPEKYVESEKTPKQEKKSQGLERYYIKKALLNKAGGVCPDCLESKKLRLYRVNKNGDNLSIADYMILCDTCIKKRKEEKKKTKLWSRKLGAPSGSPGNSEIGFFIQIRPLVFARDGAECPYCDSKENLGLGALMPLSRGGKRCFDNYTVICQKCRGKMSGNKDNKPMTPLEYFWQREGLKSDLSESLDHGVTTQNPGATIRMNVHLWARYEKLLAMVRLCKNLEELAKIRNTAETLHIEFCKTDEDRRSEREQLIW